MGNNAVERASITIDAPIESGVAGLHRRRAMANVGGRALLSWTRRLAGGMRDPPYREIAMSSSRLDDETHLVATGTPW